MSKTKEFYHDQIEKDMRETQKIYQQYLNEYGEIDDLAKKIGIEQNLCNRHGNWFSHDNLLRAYELAIKQIKENDNKS